MYCMYCMYLHVLHFCFLTCVLDIASFFFDTASSFDTASVVFKTELFPTESWIKGIFEPLRDAQFNGRPMQPPAMTFMMQEKPMREDAEVAVLLGLHQTLGGPYKLVYVFRRYKCVHVYECISHGREFWFSLHLTTDNRYTLLDLQPSLKQKIKADPPDWWLRGAGAPYPTSKPYDDSFGDRVSTVFRPCFFFFFLTLFFTPFLCGPFLCLWTLFLCGPSSVNHLCGPSFVDHLCGPSLWTFFY
jgi:hypothetical protein